MKRAWGFPAVILVVFLVLAARQLPQPVPQPVPQPAGFSLAEPDDCLICHDDDAMTMEKDGREISLYVDPAAYAASPHAGLDCVECHEGFDPEEEPHREIITPVDCASCHASETHGFRRGAHAAETTCQTCHAQSYHAPAPARSALEQDCRTCHTQAEADLRHSAHAAAEAGPQCLDCHASHAVEEPTSETCLTCHGDTDFVRDHLPGQDPGAVAALGRSVHAQDVSCADCHTGHAVRPVAPDTSLAARLEAAETCADCHREAAAHYARSEHAMALAEGFAGAPTCLDCHGRHDVLAVDDTTAAVSRARQPELCQSCHSDTPAVRDRMRFAPAFMAAYAESVHGRALAAGDLEAAVCSDCHGGHDVLTASDPAARTNPFNLTATCRTCHEEESHAFDASIHGRALAAGVGDAPTCTTCHGEHAIFARDDPRAPVSVTKVSQQVCKDCHSSLRITEKFGMPADRASSFEDSFHGLAGRFGSTEEATCASCHGVHDILPSTDPASRVHQANLAETCGTCHPGANANFARGKVHVVRTADGDPLLYWISTIYVFLIVAIVGAMFLHNLLDWLRKLVERHEARRRPHAPMPFEPKTRMFVRMTGNERIQHAALASSFILLVVTGFMLKFPDAWWVEAIRSVSGSGLFETRGLLHRIAGGVMVAGSCYHLYYILFTERGRRFVRDIWVNGQDVKDLWQMLRFNVGAARERPRFGRFNYVEKAEYWSLIWGTVVMSATGFVLWFENTFMGLFSKTFIDVSETIHYFEAWLAFLAIVVWHFYYVIFNPDAYPVNLTFLTGKVTEEEMEREHPLELEALLAEAEARVEAEAEAGADPKATA